LEPAIKPFHGQVNARDVYDIERFDETATRGVVVTPEDNAKYYGHFDHIMSHQWQQEILSEFLVPLFSVAASVAFVPK
jgi:beta-adrenergic-receptor kinase